MSILALRHARDVASFGAKATALATALCADLPVPDGIALSVRAVEAIVAGDEGVLAELRGWPLDDGARAVRSSAIGEDSATASFAGTHLSVLGICGFPAVRAAIASVHGSALEPAARAYRSRMGLADTCAPMAVIVQRLVDADVAGVMFTRNPLTGADERIIEASWGLGEAVVSGIVTPDHYRVDRGGAVLESEPGDKDVALRRGPDGAVVEVSVPAELVRAPCLSARHLVALDELAARCDEAYGPKPHDIEFAFAGGRLYLLQRRPITVV